MKPIFAMLMLSPLLVSCYMPNQVAVEKEVQNRVVVGMPRDAALKELEAAGFHCAPGDDVTCARTRQRLLPSSCIERVNLKTDGKPGPVGRITAVTVAPVVCTGL